MRGDLAVKGHPQSSHLRMEGLTKAPTRSHLTKEDNISILRHLWWEGKSQRSHRSHRGIRRICWTSTTPPVLASADDVSTTGCKWLRELESPEWCSYRLPHMGTSSLDWLSMFSRHDSFRIRSA